MIDESEQPIEPLADDAPPADEEQDDILLEALEDRIGAFAPFTIAADFLELREIYAGFFERVKEESWDKRTERRPQAWTMRQTVAHLGAAASLYHEVILANLEERPLNMPSVEEHPQLSAWNRAEIEARAEQTPDELCAAFLDQLNASARLAAQLQPIQLLRGAAPPFYGGAPTLAELFGGSLSHAGIVHAAQVAAPTRSSPLWVYYRPAMMRRQLTRLFHILGRVYWPERGGDLRATLAYTAIGPGGGSWFVKIGPEGGHGRIGVVRSFDVRLTFASPDLLCRTLTVQVNLLRELLFRRIKVEGKLRLARDLNKLFLPK